MEVNRSGFYKWLKQGKSATELEDERLIVSVKKIHKKKHETYGKRRMARELSKEGKKVGRRRARSLMRKAGVKAKQKRKFKSTTDSKHSLPVAPNLLNQDFVVSGPNQVYVGDITYIKTLEGWLYLAVVIDLFNREVVGWAMNKRMKKSLVIRAMRMAINHRRPGPGAIFHSDRGSQYCSKAFQKFLKVHGMRSSMSKKGCCYDNAVAESFFGSLKTELVFHRRYKTRLEARTDIVEYIEMFYNSTRMHSFLGYMSPREFMKFTELKLAA